jgi:hypothetical protein
MSYCVNPATELGGHIEGQSQVPKPSGSVTVAVSPATECQKSGSNKLPDGTYFIRWHNGAGASAGFTRVGYDDYSNDDTTKGSRKRVADCMEGASGSRVGNTAGYSVTGGNFPATSVTVNSTIANGATDESAICVSDARGFYGNQAPVSVY